MRSLEREIAKLARKAVKEILTNTKKTVVVTPENLEGYLGVRSTATARPSSRTRSASSRVSPGPRSAASS